MNHFCVFPSKHFSGYIGHVDGSTSHETLNIQKLTVRSLPIGWRCESRCEKGCEKGQENVLNKMNGGKQPSKTITIL